MSKTREVATARLDAKGVSYNQARQIFASENPDHKVLALKKAKAKNNGGSEYLAFLEKKAYGDSDVDAVKNEGPPLTDDSPVDLDEVMEDGFDEEPASDYEGKLDSLQDLLGQAQDALDSLRTMSPEGEEDSFEDEFPEGGEFDEPEPVAGDEEDFITPMSHILERPKEAGLTKRKARREVEQLVRSTPKYRNYKVAKVIEDKNVYKAVLARK